jgi:uncharacterized iron-regulated membrane protein
LIPLLVLAMAIAAPAAQAASVTTSPATAPHLKRAFRPLPPYSPGYLTDTSTQKIDSTRTSTGGIGQGTLLLLVGVSFALIFGVGGMMWFDGRSRRGAGKRRRQRLRSGRTPQAHPQVAGMARRGPPPPPRKRSQSARRKKR